MNNCKTIEHCLACGSENIDLCLDLGSQPLANDFRDEVSDLQEKFPLAVNYCNDCYHLQLTHIVDPAIIYRNYLYVSGTSTVQQMYMQWFAGFVEEMVSNGSTNLSVLDIGCNDGTQLDHFAKRGWKTFGVDPAENLYSTSSQKGHSVICDFWSAATQNVVGDKKFDAIVVQNAFAHNPDPLTFLTLAKKSLTDRGLIFITTSQCDMVIKGEFDTIYHEHISYYSAHSMNQLAKRANLSLVDAIKIPSHGTSYIFVLGHTDQWPCRKENILMMETAAGLTKKSTYDNWANSVSERIISIRTEVESFIYRGYHIIGYGAAAKGMTLLNASQVEMDAVIDDNVLKQGRWCPGRNVPVVAANFLDYINQSDPVLFVPLAWNFYDEIYRKIKSVRNNSNDYFLKYFPDIQVTR
jgi:2-polyprenyl-3-methyl-5-hydroxy-6-metoxy-1,4-benzoquinol methylase